MKTATRDLGPSREGRFATTVGDMTAYVVYESMFGSTQAVARAIAEGLGEHTVVRCVEISDWVATPGGSSLPDDASLLVVGAPTHAFSLSRESTRSDAATKTTAALVTHGTGIREWLDALRLPDGIPIATFDTKVAKPNLPGSAARAAEKRLRKLGGHPLTPAHTFWVLGTTGGLRPGQLDEARAWGRTLVRSLVS